MKKRYVILSGLLALTLAACSQEKPKVEENTQKIEQTSQPEGTVGSKSQASSQKKAEVVNKGDYYSIQGKYDEIVIANKHYPLSKDYNPGENPIAKAELLKPGAPGVNGCDGHVLQGGCLLGPLLQVMGQVLLHIRLPMLDGCGWAAGCRLRIGSKV